MVTQEITEWVEPRPNAVICDHDAESRRNFERATGLSTVPAVKRVNEGIDLVMRRLDNGEIRIMEDALVERDQRLADRAKPLCLNDEWGMYEWKTSNENTQEEPRKLYDDGLDCVRYMVAHLDTRNIPRASLIER
jgi:phage terminase large subunit